MPIYEYICKDCEKTTEALRRMGDADSPIACEHCGSEETARAASVFAAQSPTAGDPAPMPPCGRCGDPRGACGL